MLPRPGPPIDAQQLAVPIVLGTANIPAVELNRSLIRVPTTTPNGCALKFTMDEQFDPQVETSGAHSFNGFTRSLDDDFRDF